MSGDSGERGGAEALTAFVDVAGAPIVAVACADRNSGVTRGGLHERAVVEAWAKKCE